MGVAITETFAGRMSGPEFRSFQKRRPDRDAGTMDRRQARDLARPRALLIVQQTRIEAQVDIKTASGWESVKMCGPQAELNLPQFGLKSSLGELHAGTPHQPRPVRQHRQ